MLEAHVLAFGAHNETKGDRNFRSSPVRCFLVLQALKLNSTIYRTLRNRSSEAHETHSIVASE